MFAEGNGFWRCEFSHTLLTHARTHARTNPNPNPSPTTHDTPLACTAKSAVTSTKQLLDCSRRRRSKLQIRAVSLPRLSAKGPKRKTKMMTVTVLRWRHHIYTFSLRSLRLSPLAKSRGKAGFSDADLQSQRALLALASGYSLQSIIFSSCAASVCATKF